MHPGEEDMKMIKPVALCLLVTLLAGCGANLDAVREYAGESAKLASYAELTKRFRDTYEREQPYLSGKADTLARENDKRRKAAYKDLIAIHQRVTMYMRTLARLAGDETYDISENVGTLAAGITVYPDFGINQDHADAIVGISKTVARWMTSAIQEQAVKEMVRQGDPDLQRALDGMLALVRYYQKTNENERKTVLGFFEVEIPFADAPKDKLLATLARAHVQARTMEYDAAQGKYADAERGIKSIAEGHKELLMNIEELSKDEVLQLISRIAKDIKAVREILQSSGS